MIPFFLPTLLGSLTLLIMCATAFICWPFLRLGGNCHEPLFFALYDLAAVL
jgi:hypothetical protein